MITMILNGKKITENVAADTILLDFLRDHGCFSVKRGCETANCGLCTVLVNEKPMLTCSVLAQSVDGKSIVTLEGMQEEALAFSTYMAAQGADQCGFCSPGLVMNLFAMKKELKNPSVEEIKAYLSGNLCRCTGYQSQLRAISNYLKEVAQ